MRKKGYQTSGVKSWWALSRSIGLKTIAGLSPARQRGGPTVPAQQMYRLRERNGERTWGSLPWPPPMGGSYGYLRQGYQESEIRIHQRVRIRMKHIHCHPCAGIEAEREKRMAVDTFWVG